MNRIPARPDRRRTASALAVCTLSLAAAACGGDATDPDIGLPAEIVARWIAGPDCGGCGFTAVSISDPADSLNIVKVLQIPVVMDISSNGSFRLTHGSSASDGTARLAKPGTLVITDAVGAIDTMDYAIRADTLAMSLRRVFVIDVSGDGEPDSVRARGTFRRQ